MNDYLTTAQAAVQLGCTARAIRLMIRTGRIVAAKLGRDWMIDPAALVGVTVHKGWTKGKPRKFTDTPVDYW